MCPICKPDTITNICAQFDLVHCVDPFREKALFGKSRYYRLHGTPPGEKMYRYTYLPQDFERLKQIITDDSLKNFEIYCLFNTISMWKGACVFQNLWEDRYKKKL